MFIAFAQFTGNSIHITSIHKGVRIMPANFKKNLRKNDGRGPDKQAIHPK